jgi:formate dehydrogenase accessory protein FdhE
MRERKWDARIERARELESKYSFASEGLRFYQRVVQAQQLIYSHLVSRLGTARKQRSPGMLRQELNLFVPTSQIPNFLTAIAESAPPALAERARELRGQTENRQREILTRFWQEDAVSPSTLEPAEALLARMFLQPYAEYLADCTERVTVDATPSRCPLCGCRPQVGVLRREGDGAKRSLICSLCAYEWEFRRLVCAECGEEDAHKLAVYTAEDFAHVRVETCNTCRHYLKTVDLTKDGRAVPVVDELATIPLNLWAAEHGYVKSQTNPLGI